MRKESHIKLSNFGREFKVSKVDFVFYDDYSIIHREDNSIVATVTRLLILGWYQ